MLEIFKKIIHYAWQSGAFRQSRDENYMYRRLSAVTQNVCAKYVNFRISIFRTVSAFYYIFDTKKCFPRLLSLWFALILHQIAFAYSTKKVPNAYESDLWYNYLPQIDRCDICVTSVANYLTISFCHFLSKFSNCRKPNSCESGDKMVY